jgi:putative ABC transport system substrate-binding protein
MDTKDPAAPIARRTFPFLFIILISTVTLWMQPGCKKDEITNFYLNTEYRTLVFISDYEESSDVALSVMGSLLKEFPDLQIEFVQASPFDLKEAGYLLEMAARNYPDSTFFMGMVEPGINPPRIVFESLTGQRFLVPDNGLASRVFRYIDTIHCYRVENLLDDQGQDPSDLPVDEFYIKAATALLSGRELREFGPPAADPVTYPIQDAVMENDTVTGEIIFTDNFGNCITNIPDTLFQETEMGVLLKINAGQAVFFATYGMDYSSVPVGQNVVLMDHSDRIQLSVNFGDMSQRYGLTAGTPVKLYGGPVRIGVLQYNETSDPFVDTMKCQLRSYGFDTASNAVYFVRNANGDQSQLQDLVEDLLSEGIDILIPFSTPAAQAAVMITPETLPVVFSVVTDPESAGILDKRTNVTGLSNATDVNAVITFLERLLPGISSAGSVYNSEENNSAGAQVQLEDLFPFYGIDFIHAAISTYGGISEAYQQVAAANPEVILITNDNTMTLLTTTLVTLALQDTIPVTGTDYANTQMGALASISVDYDLIAKQTGDVACAIIRGMDPDDLPVRYFETNVIAVNTQTAAVLGYVFDPEILEEARYIFP